MDEGNHTLEGRLGYTFHDPTLLGRALTHRSLVQEAGLTVGDQNERLEFLGDAVLQLVVSDILFDLRHRAEEGELSRLRSHLVCQTTLAQVARHLQLGSYLRLGHGEERNGGRDKDSILCAAYEAVVGAIYQDGGMVVVRPLVEDHLTPIIDALPDFVEERDSKTQLQEFTQARWRCLPRYEVVAASGPDHDRRFRVAVWLEERCLGEGEGSSKKAAQRAAAQAALEGLKGSGSP